MSQIIVDIDTSVTLVDLWREAMAAGLDADLPPPGVFEVTFDACFDRVVAECRRPRDGRQGEGSTWISEEIASVYGDLHRDGHAHSVEAWSDGRLVGGAHGLVLGGVWSGESMFSRVRAGRGWSTSRAEAVPRS